jgi:hypothetical protein
MMRRLAITVGLILSLGMLDACTRAGDGSSTVTGIRYLPLAEIQELKEIGGFSQSEYPDWQVVGGFDLDSLFDGDLGKGAKIPVKVTVQRSPRTDGKKRVLILAVLKEFTAGEVILTRFSAVAIGNFDSKNQSITASSIEINRRQDPKKSINRKNNSQIGKYLLFETVDGGVAFFAGKTKKRFTGEKPTDSGDFLISSSNSPFVTKSGAATHKYFMPVSLGSNGFLTAFENRKEKDAIDLPSFGSSEYSAAGNSADFKDVFEEKIKRVPISIALTNTALNLFSENAGTDTKELGGWKLISKDIALIQPLSPGGIPVPEEVAHGPQWSEPEPESDVTSRKTDDRDPQVDFSCNGLDVRSESTLLPYSAKNLGNRGWIYTGNVIATAQQHEIIFGNPEELANVSEGEYLEITQGYCLLSTGDAQYRKGEASSAHLIPIDNRRSDISQKVKIPEDAVSIQLRVAFFSQEFPEYIGSPISDSFFVKFDEEIEFIGTGSFADAGSLNAIERGQVKDCANIFDHDSNPYCGSWQSISEVGDLPADLWNVNHSTQAVPALKEFNCSGEACYHGWVPPRVICKNIEPLQGKTRTLRISVSDVGDDYYDSALAVDSIVFSTKNCTESFTREPILKL